MRITARTLAIAFPLLLAGCKGTEHVVGTPTNMTEFRTLASMQPYITKALTVRKAQEQFGNPNAKTTAGEIVLIYNVEDSKRVTLGFPNLEGQILFALLSDKSGATTDLVILP